MSTLPHILTIDPGACAGLALVQQMPVGQRPRLLGAWVIHGSRYRPWARRLEAALDEAAALAGTAGWRVYLEKSAPARRRGRGGTRGVGGDQQGLATVEGMGRYGGAARHAAWRRCSDHEPALVPQSAWAKGLNIPTKKLPGNPWASTPQPEGLHRYDEAALLLAGGRELLAELRQADDPERGINAAEAALIGAYVAFHLLPSPAAGVNVSTLAAGGDR